MIRKLRYSTQKKHRRIVQTGFKLIQKVICVSNNRPNGKAPVQKAIYATRKTGCGTPDAGSS
jgi:hypothetical protein